MNDFGTIKVHEKTIYKKFPEVDALYTSAAKNLLIEKPESEKEVVNSYWYFLQVYDRWKHKIYLDQPGIFFPKFISHFATTYFEILKRETIFNKLYSDIKMEVDKLVDIRTIKRTTDDHHSFGDEKKSTTDDFEREINQTLFQRNEERKGKKVIERESPYETIDLLGQAYGHVTSDEYKGRANWLGDKIEEDTGYIAVEKDKDGNIVYGEDGEPNKIINPNWMKQFNKMRNEDESTKRGSEKADKQDTFHGTIEETVDTQEQPIIMGQMLGLVRYYRSFETDVTDYVESFSFLFSNIYVPNADYVWNPITWEYDFVDFDVVAEKKKKEAEKKGLLTEEIKEITIDPDKDLSEDEWKDIWEAKKKPCMPTWYLEQVRRYQKRIKKKGNLEDYDNQVIELCDQVMDTFYRFPYVPSISVYESVMGSPDMDWKQYVVDVDNIDKVLEKEGKEKIGDTKPAKVIGFREFKGQMWENLKIALDDRELGLLPFQVFPYLLGPPGTGKSEITRRLAQAYRRPIELINVGGMTDPGELKGKRPTLQSASYGKVMAAFIEKSVLADITIADLEREIYEIKNRVDAGVWSPRPEYTITEWEKDRIRALELEIQEWKEENEEKRKDGQAEIIFKKKAYRSRAPILLLDEFEKCGSIDVMNVIGAMTDRELNYTFEDAYFKFKLPLNECIILLTANYLDQVPQFVKDRGQPVNIELLTWAQRKDILQARFKKEMQTYRIGDMWEKGMISEKFIEMCIPETWGIRGGINNVAAAIRFLRVINVDQKDNVKKSLPGKPVDDLINKGGLENFDEIYETPMAEYKKRQGGIIRLSYYLAGKKRDLTLTKRIGIEKRVIKEGNTEKEVFEIITGKDMETGKLFVPDWGNGSEDYPAQTQWWEDSYIVRSVMEDEENTISPDNRQVIIEFIASSLQGTSFKKIRVQAHTPYQERQADYIKIGLDETSKYKDLITGNPGETFELVVDKGIHIKFEKAIDNTRYLLVDKGHGFIRKKHA